MITRNALALAGLVIAVTTDSLLITAIGAGLLFVAAVLWLKEYEDTEI